MTLRAYPVNFVMEPKTDIHTLNLLYIDISPAASEDFISISPAESEDIISIYHQLRVRTL